MNIEQKRLLKKLEVILDSKFEKLFEGAHEGFAYYFSKFDIEGIKRLLSGDRSYDGVSKDHYINLISKAFKVLNSKGVNSFNALSGKCNGCKKGCSGYTFIDSKTGIYVDLIMEVEKSEIINFMECYDLKNSEEISYKKERLVIKSTIK